MRKNSILFAGIFALSLGFVGCNSDELEGAQSGDSQTQAMGTPIDFSAEFDTDVKKIVYGAIGPISAPILWMPNDKVRIYSPTGGVADGEQSGAYSASTTVNAATTKFAYDDTYVGVNTQIGKAATSTQSFYATYPETPVFEDGKVAFTIPVSQTLKTGTVDDGMKNVLLYAKEEGVNNSQPVSFAFKNIPTVIAVDLTGNDRVIKKIEIQATGTITGKPIAGTFTGNVGSDPTVGNFAAAGYAASATSDRVNVTPQASNGGAFINGILYIAIAPYEYTGLNVKFIADGYTYTISHTGTGIAPRKLYRLAKNGLDWMPITPVTPANSRDLGILVVSDVNPGSGLVQTRMIGYIPTSGDAGARAWKVCDIGDPEISRKLREGTVTEANKLSGVTAANALRAAGAVPLRFASGNLHIPSGLDPADLVLGGQGFIAPVEMATMDFGNGTSTGYGVGTLNNGFFGAGDPTGANQSTSYGPTGTDYARNLSISGTATDIARHQLGGKWRMMTALELAFLLEEVSTTALVGVTGRGTTTVLWADFTLQANYEQTKANPTNFFRDVPGQYGCNIISKLNNQSIYLPALGNRTGASYVGRTNPGLYWTGTYAGSIYSLRSFRTIPGYWSILSTNTYYGLPVRPVSE